MTAATTPVVAASLEGDCLGRKVREVSFLLTEAEAITDGQADTIHDICAPILDNPKFLRMSASRTGKHHHFVGGLQAHTAEVLDIAVAQLRCNPDPHSVDWMAVIVGAVWHDAGKIIEYDFDDPTAAFSLPFGCPFGPDSIVYTPLHVHHITGGIAMFGRAISDTLAQNTQVDQRTAGHILHIIESHHGRREWSSPNAPKTIEALAVHQADMLSVMQDSGKNPGSRPDVG